MPGVIGPARPAGGISESARYLPRLCRGAPGRGQLMASLFSKEKGLSNKRAQGRRRLRKEPPQLRYRRFPWGAPAPF